MPTLADLAHSFAEDAADCGDPTCRDHLMEVEPERILTLFAVVEAARSHTCEHFHAPGSCSLDQALAALDALEAGS